MSEGACRSDATSAASYWYATPTKGPFNSCNPASMLGNKDGSYLSIDLSQMNTDTGAVAKLVSTASDCDELAVDKGICDANRQGEGMSYIIDLTAPGYGIGPVQLPDFENWNTFKTALVTQKKDAVDIQNYQPSADSTKLCLCLTQKAYADNNFYACSVAGAAGDTENHWWFNSGMTVPAPSGKPSNPPGPMVCTQATPSAVSGAVLEPRGAPHADLSGVPSKLCPNVCFPTDGKSSYDNQTYNLGPKGTTPPFGIGGGSCDVNYKAQLLGDLQSGCAAATSDGNEGCTCIGSS